MTKGLLTTSVGSFPKPDYLVKARNKAARGEMAPQELQELERQALSQRSEIEQQPLAGGDLVDQLIKALCAGMTRGTAADNGEQNRSQAINIRAGINRVDFSTGLLRRHVIGGPDDLSGHMGLVEETCGARFG